MIMTSKLISLSRSHIIPSRAITSIYSTCFIRISCCTMRPSTEKLTTIIRKIKISSRSSIHISYCTEKTCISSSRNGSSICFKPTCWTSCHSKSFNISTRIYKRNTIIKILNISLYGIHCIVPQC